MSHIKIAFQSHASRLQIKFTPQYYTSVSHFKVLLKVTFPGLASRSQFKITLQGHIPNYTKHQLWRESWLVINSKWSHSKWNDFIDASHIWLVLSHQTFKFPSEKWSLKYGHACHLKVSGFTNNSWHQFYKNNREVLMVFYKWCAVLKMTLISSHVTISKWNNVAQTK